MKKKIIEFVPFIAMLFASAVTLIVYLVVMQQSDAVKILEACVALLIPLIIPLLNRILHIRIPFAFNVVLTVFSFAAIDFASVLDFYTLIPHFDKVMHTAFGIVGGFGVFIFLLYGNGSKLKPWCFFLLILLSVLGMAAIWEIYEFIASSIINSNMQGWIPDMNEFGDMTVREFFSDYNPLWDTIWDMIVAAFGVFIFYGLVIVDKLCGYKVCKSIYEQVNFRNKEELKDENSDTAQH